MENFISPLPKAEIHRCAYETNIALNVAFSAVLPIYAWGKWEFHKRRLEALGVKGDPADSTPAFLLIQHTLKESEGEIER